MDIIELKFLRLALSNWIIFYYVCNGDRKNLVIISLSIKVFWLINIIMICILIGF